LRRVVWVAVWSSSVPNATSSAAKSTITSAAESAAPEAASIEPTTEPTASESARTGRRATETEAHWTLSNFGVVSSTQPTAEASRFPAHDGATALDVDEDAATADGDAIGFLVSR
jgi:hypothetical protein